MNTSALDTPLPARPAHRRLQRRRRGPGWLLVSPSVALLLLWMIVPLGMTLYFSLIRYNLLYPGENAFVGVENFTFFVTDAGFLPGALNTLLLVGRWIGWRTIRCCRSSSSSPGNGCPSPSSS